MNAKRIVELYQKAYPYDPWLLATEGEDGEVILVRGGSISILDTATALRRLKLDLFARVEVAKIQVEGAEWKLLALKRVQEEVVSELDEATP